MSALVVDTSVWIAFFSGKDIPELDSALKEGRVYLSPVVASELLSGKMTDSKRSELKDFLEDLHEIPTPLAHWMRVGDLRANLAKKGISISTPDAHLAQCAMDVGGVLMSDDLIFSKIQRKIEITVVR